MALWTPKELGSALGLWLDAADPATILTAAGNPATNGERVARWLDKSVSSGARSGTARVARQDTFDRQPVYYKQAPNAPSGMPGVVRLQYSSGRMVVFPAMPFYDDAVGQAALVMAVNPGSAYGACTMFSSGAGKGGDDENDNGGPQLRFDGNGVRLVRSYQEDLGSALNNLTVAPHIAGFNAGKNALQIIADGWTNDIARSPGFNNPMSQLFANIAGGENFVGPIQEILYFLRRLTTDERRLCEGYLAWKWGTVASLQPGHTYANAAPTVSAGDTPAPVAARRRTVIIF